MAHKAAFASTKLVSADFDERWWWHTHDNNWPKAAERLKILYFFRWTFITAVLLCNCNKKCYLCLLRICSEMRIFWCASKPDTIYIGEKRRKKSHLLKTNKISSGTISILRWIYLAFLFRSHRKFSVVFCTKKLYPIYFFYLLYAKQILFWGWCTPQCTIIDGSRR